MSGPTTPSPLSSPGRGSPQVKRGHHHPDLEPRRGEPPHPAAHQPGGAISRAGRAPRSRASPRGRGSGAAAGAGGEARTGRGAGRVPGLQGDGRRAARSSKAMASRSTMRWRAPPRRPAPVPSGTEAMVRPRDGSRGPSGDEPRMALPGAPGRIRRAPMPRTSEAERAAAPGRCPAPKVPMPERGTFVGSPGAARGGGQPDCGRQAGVRAGTGPPGRLWRPFQHAPGRRDVLERLRRLARRGAALGRGAAGGRRRLPVRLAETHLRQLGLLRQASARAGRAGARALEERFLAETGATSPRRPTRCAPSWGGTSPRSTDCYRAEAAAHPSHARCAAPSSGWWPWPGSTPPSSPGTRREAGGPPSSRCGRRTWPGSLAGPAPPRRRARRGRRRRRGPPCCAPARAPPASSSRWSRPPPSSRTGPGHHLDALLAAVGAAAAAPDGFQGVPHDVPRCEGWITRSARSRGARREPGGADGRGPRRCSGGAAGAALDCAAFARGRRPCTARRW